MWKQFKIVQNNRRMTVLFYNSREWMNKWMKYVCLNAGTMSTEFVVTENNKHLYHHGGDHSTFHTRTQTLVKMSNSFYLSYVLFVWYAESRWNKELSYLIKYILSIESNFKLLFLKTFFYTHLFESFWKSFPLDFVMFQNRGGFRHSSDESKSWLL